MTFLTINIRKWFDPCKHSDKKEVSNGKADKQGIQE